MPEGPFRQICSQIFLKALSYVTMQHSEVVQADLGHEIESHTDSRHSNYNRFPMD